MNRTNRPGFVAAAAGVCVIAAQAQLVRSGPDTVGADVGDVAVLVDNGLIVTRHNVLDLDGVGVRFEPVADHLYSLSGGAATLDPDFGPALTFGYPGATLYPGDDDTQEVPFPAGFPFFGTTYTSVWVNTDGNVTFGAPEFDSDDRDKIKHVSGPPRVSAYLMDVNAHNAFNTAGVGTIHGVVKTGPDRLVVTWDGVGDFSGNDTSTFQLTLFSSGAISIDVDHIDSGAASGVVGIAEGAGRGPIQQVDVSAGPVQVLEGGAILEAFAPYTVVSDAAAARAFYQTHPDKFDFLVLLTDFPVDSYFHSRQVSNHTHGIGTQLDPATGEPFGPTEFDDTAEFGSAGELEQIVFLNNVYIAPDQATSFADPRVEPYRDGMNTVQNFAVSGGCVSLDGQPMSQVVLGGTIPPDDGEFSRFFLHGGAFYPKIVTYMSAMSQEVEHRWGARVRFVHPTKGTGLDSYDLLGRGLEHWSFFLSATIPPSQSPGVPRCPGMQGNVIVDLGAVASYNGAPTTLAPGERVFKTPADEVADGYGELDQYLMGLRRAGEVGPFYYVDEPRSIYTGQDLDIFDTSRPLDTSLSMRCWDPMGGIVFKGKRVDLTVQNIMDYERIREGKDNPKGRRFWGPKGNLKVTYNSVTRRVEPGGDASVTLAESDRELGDEADMIDANGKPVDVKTMAFVLVVLDGPPGSHNTAISKVEMIRQLWQVYGNGRATGGRGKFDTSLNPAIY